MIAAYLVRLLCLSLASFFAMNLIAGLGVRLFSSRAIRLAEAWPARTGAGILFAFRLLPFLLASGAVVLLCWPSYLRFEPTFRAEGMGAASLVLAGLGFAVLVLSLVRGARAIADLKSFQRSLGTEGVESFLGEAGLPARIIPADAPVLALAGIWKPKVVISESVRSALSAGQLALALKHERAHQTSADNLKRLVWLLAPDPAPFLRQPDRLGRAWLRLSEWAADDSAVEGSPERAVALAGLLLGVARLGSGPRNSCLNSALLSADLELAARIGRLLEYRPVPVQNPVPVLIAPAAALALVGAASLSLLYGSRLLGAVYRLLEALLR